MRRFDLIRVLTMIAVGAALIGIVSVLIVRSAHERNLDGMGRLGPAGRAAREGRSYVTVEEFNRGEKPPCCDIDEPAPASR